MFSYTPVPALPSVCSPVGFYILAFSRFLISVWMEKCLTAILKVLNVRLPPAYESSIIVLAMKTIWWWAPNQAECCLSTKFQYSKKDKNMKYFHLCWWSVQHEDVAAVAAAGNLGLRRKSVRWLMLQLVICTKQASGVQLCRLMLSVC